MKYKQYDMYDKTDDMERPQTANIDKQIKNALRFIQTHAKHNDTDYDMKMKILSGLVGVLLPYNDGMQSQLQIDLDLGDKQFDEIFHIIANELGGKK